MEFEQIQNDYFHRRKALQGLENESRNIQGTFKEMNAYIDLLEKEIVRINVQSIKMSATYPNLDLLVPRMPLQEIRKLRHKNQVEINHNLSTKFTGIIKDSDRARYCQTDIFDLSKPIK